MNCNENLGQWTNDHNGVITPDRQRGFKNIIFLLRTPPHERPMGRQTTFPYFVNISPSAESATRERYSAAANAPESALCCPVSYDPQYLKAIPAEVIEEIFRVLKKGGRAVISDIVSDEEIPEHLQYDPYLWSGCISGADTEEEFTRPSKKRDSTASKSSSATTRHGKPLQASSSAPSLEFI
jgi:SAM-dependent methyltransferase